jgi:hypothetical protein
MQADKVAEKSNTSKFEKVLSRPSQRPETVAMREISSAKPSVSNVFEVLEKK